MTGQLWHVPAKTRRSVQTRLGTLVAFNTELGGFYQNSIKVDAQASQSSEISPC